MVTLQNMRAGLGNRSHTLWVQRLLVFLLPMVLELRSMRCTLGRMALSRMFGFQVLVKQNTLHFLRSEHELMWKQCMFRLLSMDCLYSSCIVGMMPPCLPSSTNWLYCLIHLQSCRCYLQVMLLILQYVVHNTSDVQESHANKVGHCQQHSLNPLYAGWVIPLLFSFFPCACIILYRAPPTALE